MKHDLVNARSWSDQLSVRAAWMSFVGGLTQSEIARRLDVSNAKAHRLINQAREDGLVRITIEGRPDDCLAMEQRIVDQFDLNSCTIAPFIIGPDQPEGTSIAAVGQVGGHLLSSLFADKKIADKVGVGMGRTLKAAIAAMRPVNRSDLSIFSISGSLTRKLSANPYDVVLRLMDKLGAEGYLLPVPYLVTSMQEKQLLQSQPSVASLLRRARQCDLYIAGIGSLEDDGHLRISGMASGSECAELKNAGAVCDLMGSFFDIDGNHLETGLARHSIGVDVEAIGKARVFAMAAGKTKARPTLAGLRTGIITDLVIDEGLGLELERLAGQWQTKEEAPLRAVGSN